MRPPPPTKEAKRKPSFFDTSTPPSSKPKLPPPDPEKPEDDVDSFVEKSVAQIVRPPSVAPEISIAADDEVMDEAAGEELANAEGGKPEDENSDPDLEARRAADLEQVKRLGSHIPDDAFNVPSVGEAPPSDRKISSLSKLEGSLGFKLSSLAKDSLSTEDAALLEMILLDGKWPSTEEELRRTVVYALCTIEPMFKNSDKWTQLSLPALIKTFLEFLEGKEGNYAAAAKKLRKSPPPLPTSTKATSKGPTTQELSPIPIPVQRKKR